MQVNFPHLLYLGLTGKQPASGEINFGTFEGCLETMEWTPLEPGEREHKFYSPGMGLVLELQPKGGRIMIELLGIDMA